MTSEQIKKNMDSLQREIDSVQRQYDSEKRTFFIKQIKFINGITRGKIRVSKSGRIRNS